MRRLCDKLLKLLNISGRDFAVFLLALLLAFSIWLIHNLSLKYNSYLDVTVQARCNIDGHSDLSSDYANVVARCRATGYNVIRSGISGRRRVVEVNFQPSVMKHKEDDLYYVTSSDLQEYAHLIFGDGVTVEYFTTDTLFFRFPYQNSKRVPVSPVYAMTFAEQYTDVGKIEVSPDSVTVYGEPALLDNIESVSTVPLRFSNLSSDIRGDVKLERIRGVRMSDEKVHYALDVSRYVEFSGTFPVLTENVPADKHMNVIPSNVSLTVKCVFPLKSSPLDEVRLGVDYNDFIESISGKCVVDMISGAEGIIEYDIYPPVVECFVEDEF